MTNKHTVKTSDKDFADSIKAIGIARTAKKFGISERGAYKRRANIEKVIGEQITVSDVRGTRHDIKHPQRIPLDVHTGCVIIGGDCHYWPGIITTAHRAFVKLAKELNPKALILNGDVFDGASVSRHPPIGWENRPTVIEELGACQSRLAEMENAAPKALKIWSLGNHDGRFETRLATVAPEYAKVHGFHLKDHFPKWDACWSTWINEKIVVKHRWKGGVHATHNNTLGAGVTIVTNHLHGLKVTPYSDYNGTRWGVDTGTLAEPDGPQFMDYCEDNPTNWRSGFVVLNFVKGVLLWPDIVHVIGPKQVTYQGKIITV